MKKLNSGTILERYDVKEYLDILGVKVSATNLTQAALEIDAWIKDKSRKYVCVAPVSTIVDCQNNADYRQIVNNAGMTTPDGMPLVWLGKLQGNRNIERTYGPDLMHTICSLSPEKGYKHFIYGGTDEGNIRLMTKLKSKYEGISIVGAYAPGIQDIGKIEEKRVIEMINGSNPDILWVGLGSPKQDYWMRNHRDKLNVPVMIGVGAAFDFISGVKKQAPKWMQRSGLEWVFRLCSEPKRLWKRYLVGNTVFLFLLIKNQLFSGTKRS